MKRRFLDIILHPITIVIAIIVVVPTVASLVEAQTRPAPRAPASVDDSAWLQACVDSSSSEQRPVIITGPKQLKIGTPVKLKPGTELIAQGRVILEATGLCPTIFTTDGNVENVRLVGFQFFGTGCSGIDAELSWSKLERLTFWTSLYQGARLRGTGTVLEDCGFGTAGDKPTSGTHLHLKLGGDGNSTHYKLRDCRFFNALGDGAAVEAGGMYQVSFDHVNFERNQSRVALKLSGAFSANLTDCWFENNSGAAQIELRNDATNSIGNYSVDVRSTWINLGGDGNLWVIDHGGASKVTFESVNGTNFTNKRLSNIEGSVGIAREGRLVGYRQP